MRSCTTRSTSSCHFDLSICCGLVFFNSILELFLLVMQGVVPFDSIKNLQLDERSFEDREDKLAVVLELLHVVLVFGLFVELLPGLSVPSEKQISSGTGENGACPS